MLLFDRWCCEVNGLTEWPASTREAHSEVCDAKKRKNMMGSVLDRGGGGEGNGRKKCSRLPASLVVTRIQISCFEILTSSFSKFDRESSEYKSNLSRSTYWSFKDFCRQPRQYCPEKSQQHKPILMASFRLTRIKTVNRI